MNDIKKKVIELANKSSFKYKHGAVITYNGFIIGSGYNVNFKHPDIEKFNQYKTLHAEMVAIFRVKNKKLLKNSELFVCRINKFGNTVMSKPCPVCINICKSFGIKKINYTNNNGIWITEEL